jgi:hypothetical protein
MVARDGIEPPTRPFQGRLPNRGSGLKSTDATKVQELTSSLFQANVGSLELFAALRCSRIVRATILQTNGRIMWWKSEPHSDASSGPISGL